MEIRESIESAGDSDEDRAMLAELNQRNHRRIDNAVVKLEALFEAGEIDEVNRLVLVS